MLKRLWCRLRGHPHMEDTLGEEMGDPSTWETWVEWSGWCPTCKRFVYWRESTV